MTSIINLDAEIEQFYAEQGDVDRAILMFGREWPLIPVMTSTTLSPLVQIQAAVQMAQSGQLDEDSMEAQRMLMQFMGSVNGILANAIREDVRPQFRAVLDERGFPMPLLDKVIEAIMQAFDAAPFGSETPTSAAPGTVPPPASSTTSGSSPEAAGGTSTPISGSTPSATPPHGQPVPVAASPQPVSAPQPVQEVQNGLRVAEWGQEPTLPAYSEDTALIPPSVQDVPPLS